MKWYHFGLIFMLVFGGIFLAEQKEEITTRLWETGYQTEYDCLVAAVNAATRVYFEQEGKMGEERLLADTGEAFFQTLSFLHDLNTDAAGMQNQREKVPVLAVFAQDGFYVYRRENGGFYGWSSKWDYSVDGEIPDEFYRRVGELVSDTFLGTGEKRKSRFVRVREGTWEKMLTPGCVFAVYAPDFVGLSEYSPEYVIYAASKKMEEHYPVTSDLLCHRRDCSRAAASEIIAEFSSQRKAALYGAAPCPSCLLWRDEREE